MYFALMVTYRPTYVATYVHHNIAMDLGSYTYSYIDIIRLRSLVQS